MHTGTEIKRPLLDLLNQAEIPVEVAETALRGLRNPGQLDEEVRTLLFRYLHSDQVRSLRREAVTALGILSSASETVRRIHTEILQAENYDQHLDALYLDFGQIRDGS
ncbi:MAG: hypothetical protein GY862_33255 [Gammaproteobacteria bacterium]|nr:hypothetical protein [Gammaproteobacteria bacterium]